MRELMDQLFRRYGSDAVLLRGEQQYAVKAFFHSDFNINNIKRLGKKWFWMDYSPDQKSTIS